jgi:uncharacterized phage-associated protein
MFGHKDKTHLTFDVVKAVAAVGFLVKHTGESMYSVMKMMYLADKLHLERYGQFISGDSYAAMKEGPVPSCTYNMMKFLRGNESSFPSGEIVRAQLAYDGTSDHRITLLVEPKVDELSESDLECLGRVVELYKQFGKWGVRDMSHDEAWRGVWKNVLPGFKARPIPTREIAKQLDSELLEHVEDPFPGTAHV